MAPCVCALASGRASKARGGSGGGECGSTGSSSALVSARPVLAALMRVAQPAKSMRGEATVAVPVVPAISYGVV